MRGRDTEPSKQFGSLLSPSACLIGRLGALVWDQWAALRHAAAVIGTVLGVSVRPRSWVRPPLPEKNACIVCNEQFQSALELAVEEIHREAMLVLKKVSGGLETWTRLGADLGETRQRLDQLSVRLANLAAGVEAGKGTVGRLLTDTTLADEAENLLARANETMSELRGVVTNLNVAAKHVQNGTARLPEITDAVADEAKDLPGLVRQTQTSMRELERLIEAMQRHWLLRKYVNKASPPPLHPLPGSAEPEKQPIKVLRSPRGSTQ